MSADNIDQISLRSFDQSSRTSRRLSSNAGLGESHIGEDPSVEQLPQDLDQSTHVAECYIDGGYGWVVTAGMSVLPTTNTDISGAFTLLFLQLGTLYAWGVFQAELANQKLGSSVVLSTIGGLSGFCTALGCLPVSFTAWIMCS